MAAAPEEFNVPGVKVYTYGVGSVVVIVPVNVPEVSAEAMLITISGVEATA